MHNFRVMSLKGTKRDQRKVEESGTDIFSFLVKCPVLSWHLGALAREEINLAKFTHLNALVMSYTPLFALLLCLCHEGRNLVYLLYSPGYPTGKMVVT